MIGYDEGRRASASHGHHQVAATGANDVCMGVGRMQEAAEMGDGVDAELGLGAVSGAAREGDADDSEAPK